MCSEVVKVAVSLRVMAVADVAGRIDVVRVFWRLRRADLIRPVLGGTNPAHKVLPGLEER